MSASLTSTPGQTVGPFFGYALPFVGDHGLVPTSRPGALQLHGRVYDGDGAPVPDALIEVWQRDPAGELVRQQGSLQRDAYTFTGWGRCATDPTGHYAFTTVRPGAAGASPPFFALTVFARGLLDRLFTRAYLPGDEALSTDPLLGSLSAERRDTLIAVEDAHGFVFDVHLQGDAETVFLAFPGGPGRR